MHTNTKLFISALCTISNLFQYCLIKTAINNETLFRKFVLIQCLFPSEKQRFSVFGKAKGSGPEQAPGPSGPDLIKVLLSIIYRKQSTTVPAPAGSVPAFRVRACSR